MEKNSMDKILAGKDSAESAFVGSASASDASKGAASAAAGPAETGSAKTASSSRRSLAIALVVLIVVIAAAGLGYSRLAATGAAMEPASDAAGSASASAAGSSEGSGKARGFEEADDSAGIGASSKAAYAFAGKGASLADFDSKVRDAEGKELSFSEIADGKVLVINFWATWCPYCVKEFPDYQQIYEEYGDRVSFAMVNVTDGQRETVDSATAFIEDQGYGFPVYFDTSFQAVYDYNAGSLPTTVVISADGRVLQNAPGVINPDALRGMLDAQLA